ncbi:MAG: DUF664 domain-containing protein [Acidimicrobiia bacterium]|nr:DUF664 domain-containing protein [Acidimicrobiia bacterium]
MDATEVLIDTFDRLPELVHGAVEALHAEHLTSAPREGANTIGWLIWHTARVQDAQIAHVAGHEQAWVTGDWAPKFGMGPDPANTGYGHSPDEMAAVQVETSESLVSYYEAVHARTMTFLRTLSADDLDRIVDDRYDPPATLGARLVSIAADDLQHVGQAAYLRGLLLDD